MSADRWAICPKCGDYDKEERTLAEYFEIGFDETGEYRGRFFLRYSAECRKCGFAYTTFKYEKYAESKLGGECT